MVFHETSVRTAREEVVPNSYIVVFKKDIPHDKCDAHCEWARTKVSERMGTMGADAEQYSGVKHQYKLPSGWAGYSGSFSEDMVKDLEAADEVRLVHLFPDDGFDADVLLG